MGPPSYMRSIVIQNVVMRCMTVVSWQFLIMQVSPCWD